ncbi:MAG: ABC transporter ATP-binding protein [Patescibacteria group bacterium]|nr:ABC transporter ATP-binding protein [Patescibacteria group bacterium]
MTNPIVLKNIGKTYFGSKIPAISNINLEVNKGEFLCLIGPSGCGKTTILKLIAGLEQPTTGIIEKPASVGMVFQSGALLPWLTVEENVAFPIYAKGGNKENAEDITNKYVRMVALSELKLKYPRELSGGQKQRVGIARALASEAEVLLLDEPFSALDPVTTNELHKDLLRIWKETGKTIVMVSHLIEEAILLADRIAIMQQGELKDIVDVRLKRPRNDESKEFLKTLDTIKKSLGES